MCYIILFNILYNRNNAKANILNNAYININKSDSNHEGKIVDIFHKIQDYLVNNENGILTTDIRFFKKTDLVISVYNGVLFIMQFVHSIQNQNLTNIEIIIVDDSSTDNSVSIVKGLMKEDPRIILLTNK